MSPRTPECSQERTPVFGDFRGFACTIWSLVGSEHLGIVHAGRRRRSQIGNSPWTDRFRQACVRGMSLPLVTAGEVFGAEHHEQSRRRGERSCNDLSDRSGSVVGAPCHFRFNDLRCTSLPHSLSCSVPRRHPAPRGQFICPIRQRRDARARRYSRQACVRPNRRNDPIPLGS